MSSKTVIDLLNKLTAEVHELRVEVTSAKPKRIEPDALYTLGEAAALLGKGFSAHTLRRKLQVGLLTGRKTSPSSPWLVRGIDLLRIGSRAA